MTRGRARWDDEQLRSRMPLPRERLAEPRFGVSYIGKTERIAVAFARDGTVRVNDEIGTWTAHDAVLHVMTQTWDCEGCASADSLFLLASIAGDERKRIEWELLLEDSRDDHARLERIPGAVAAHERGIDDIRTGRVIPLDEL